MVRPRQRNHSLSSGAHPEITSLVDEAPSPTRICMARTRGRKQYDGYRVAANSSPQPDIPLPHPHAFPVYQDLAPPPPSVHVQEEANYNSAQEAISKGFS